MLTILYELRYQRWLPVREYYQFTEQQYRQGALPDTHRVACPGCGRRLNIGETSAHTCLGGREPWPRLTRRFESNRRWNPRKGEPNQPPHPPTTTYILNQGRALKEYLSQNPHAPVDE